MKNKSYYKVRKNILSELGKFFIDIAKLVFGGVIVVNIMQYDLVNRWTILYVGIAAMLVSFSAGLFFLSIAEKKMKGESICN